VLSVQAQLVSSATVAARVARLLVSDGVATFLDLAASASQAASLTRRYSWFPDTTAYAVGAGIVTPTPRLLLDAGSVLSVSTDLLDATDAWTAIYLHVLETTIRQGRVEIGDLPYLYVEVIGGLPA